MSKLSVPVNENDHLQGSPSAPCVLVEYGDYQCPSCGSAYPVVKKLQRQFGDRLAFVYRNFPLTQIHRWAESAAEVAEFSGAHHKFWEMHDALYEAQRELGTALFKRLAQALELPASELDTALEEATYRPRVRQDFTGGVHSGVNGTPTFFVNGHRHNGAYDFETLSVAIERSLGGTE